MNLPQNVTNDQQALMMRHIYGFMSTQQ